MRVVISTGQGRLHLIETAKSLFAKGIDVSVIVGWIPSRLIPRKVIDFLGRLVGNKHLYYGMNKRRIPELSSKKIFTCAFSEFAIQLLFILDRFKLMTHSRAALLGWKLYGWQSKGGMKNIDILHVRSGAGQGGAIKKARKLGAKILVDHSIAHPTEVYKQLMKVATMLSPTESISPDNRFWQLVLKDCKEADVLLVNSAYVKESFVDNGFEADKITVANLGVREDFIGIKTDWSVSGELRLLFTGGFGARKGATIIIDCVDKLVQNGVKFHLDIVGSVIPDFVIPDWFCNSSSVTLHGHVPQDRLKDFLVNADIYIFPSYSEGAAQSLKEAMAVGLPVVATRQSGVEIENGVNGFIVPDDSSEALFQSLMKLSDDNSLRENMGRNASETIRNKHTWERYATDVEKAYLKLLNEKE